MQQQLKRAFTLLELLFVIAILAVMSTVGINIYRQKAMDTKLDRAALQIQQLLQSVSAYYVNNTNNPNVESPWPDNLDQPELKPYLPFGGTTNSLTNPWGHAYTGGVARLSLGHRFAITTATPNAHLAQRLASLLPNATTNDSSITAEITIPGQASATTATTKVTIAGAGTFTAGRATTTNLPTVQCPNDTTATVFNAIVDSTTTVQDAKSFRIAANGRCDPTGEENTFACKVNVENWSQAIDPTSSGIVGGDVTVNYMILCQATAS